MAKVPSLKRLDIFDREVPSELLKAAAAIAGASGGAIGAYFSGNLIGVLSGAISVLALAGLGGWLGWKAWKRDQQRSSMQHADLWGCVHVVHSILATNIGGEQDAMRLRTTLHIVVYDDKIPVRSQQATRYAGDGGGPPGREFDARVGVVGEVIRTQTACVLSWAGSDPVKFKADLMSRFYYSPQEAEGMVNARRSWMGIPLKDATGRLFAVVYCDACLPGAFNENHVNLLAGAIKGIVEFAEERFS